MKHKKFTKIINILGEFSVKNYVHSNCKVGHKDFSLKANSKKILDQ